RAHGLERVRGADVGAGERHHAAHVLDRAAPARDGHGLVSHAVRGRGAGARARQERARRRGADNGTVHDEPRTLGWAVAGRRRTRRAGDGANLSRGPRRRQPPVPERGPADDRPPGRVRV
ncbi:MAG: hypothetical protein AVDCRST_MAG11-2108, partial [uncultured Gemmatimonadaceae bacterium]